MSIVVQCNQSATVFYGIHNEDGRRKAEEILVWADANLCGRFVIAATGDHDFEVPELADPLGVSIFEDTWADTYVFTDDAAAVTFKLRWC